MSKDFGVILVEICDVLGMMRKYVVLICEYFD